MTVGSFCQVSLPYSERLVGKAIMAPGLLWISDNLTPTDHHCFCCHCPLCFEQLAFLFSKTFSRAPSGLPSLPACHPGNTRWSRFRGEDGTSRTSRPASSASPSCPLSSPLSLHPPRFGHETCCHTGWGRGPRPRVYHENQLAGLDNTKSWVRGQEQGRPMAWALGWDKTGWQDTGVMGGASHSR